jgi:cytochrome c peroxidase
MNKVFSLVFFITLLLFASCSDNESSATAAITDSYPNVTATFSSKIDLNNLSNYANQIIPPYITKDNTATNTITDKGATLGRVLFYDKICLQTIQFYVHLAIFKPTLSEM